MPLPPLAKLRRFARLLGWRDLTKHTHRIPESEAPRSTPSQRLIVWYESAAIDDTMLQINILPTLMTAVFSPRYRINSGWHAFELRATRDGMREEAARLDEWIHIRWFSSRDARRQYRLMHPECDRRHGKPMWEHWRVP